MSKWKKNNHYARQRYWARRQLIRQHGSICAICENVIQSMDDLTIDHIVPRSKGGTDELENLQLAHEKCNKAKGSLSSDEYKELQGI